MNYRISLRAKSAPKSMLLFVSTLVVAILTLFFSGCTDLKQYRTDYSNRDIAASPTNSPSCALEVTTNYVLGFVECDDQGWFWDVRQMHTVINRFIEEDARTNLLMVVFVHGWKHNASFDDDNAKMFRTNLTELAEMERRLNPRPRRIAGVYVGWRGLSNKAWLLKELTFWDRKNTAQEVGRGGITSLYAALEDLRNNSRGNLHRDRRQVATQLIVVGHSFGGALTYSALAPLLVERAIQSDPVTHTQGAVRGFGDLVVLINPAFEAARFEVLYGITTNRPTYLTNQSVNLAIFTSKSDDATKVAFPIGRWFSTFWEKYRDGGQKKANRIAVGHFGPFTTHDLVPFTNLNVKAASSMPGKPKPGPTIKSKQYKGHETIQESVEQVNRIKDQIRRHQETSVKEMPDRSYEFSAAKLIPCRTNILHMPVINVSVDHSIIPNHGDIDTQAFLTFLREFVAAFTTDELMPRR
jgi:pimeloyl-ACP methyl ester carboxylesterase